MSDKKFTYVLIGLLIALLCFIWYQDSKSKHVNYTTAKYEQCFRGFNENGIAKEISCDELRPTQEKDTRLLLQLVNSSGETMSVGYVECSEPL